MADYKKFNPFIGADMSITPEQMDFFGTHRQGSDDLGILFDRIAQEREQSIEEGIRVLEKCNQEQFMSTDGIKTVLQVIMWDHARIVGKLKAVLDIYMRDRHPGERVLGKYNEDMLASFNLLPAPDSDRYLRKINIASDENEAIASDWSRIFGDLGLAFYKECQKETVAPDE